MFSGGRERVHWNKWVNESKFFLLLEAFYNSPIADLYSKDVVLVYAKVMTKIIFLKLEDLDFEKYFMMFW